MYKGVLFFKSDGRGYYISVKPRPKINLWLTSTIASNILTRFFLFMLAILAAKNLKKFLRVARVRILEYPGRAAKAKVMLLRLVLWVMLRLLLLLLLLGLLLSLKQKKSIKNGLRSSTIF